MPSSGKPGIGEAFPYTHIHLNNKFGHNPNVRGDYATLSIDRSNPFDSEEIDLQSALLGINYNLLDKIGTSGGQVDFASVLSRAINIGAYIEGLKKGLESTPEKVNSQELNSSDMLNYLSTIKRLPGYLC